MAKYILVSGIRVAKSWEPETFGRLTTLGPQFLIPGTRTRTSTSTPHQVCMCSCGAIVVVTRTYLKRQTPSCGCNAKEIWRSTCVKRNLTHGEKQQNASTKEYNSWRAMKERCRDPKNSHYPNYGGRGIKVCDRWLGDQGFQNFLEDMGRKPSPKHSLDRIDVNGDYCPENCRWADAEEQQNNTTRTRLVTCNGKTQSVSTWGREYGVHPSVLQTRLNWGWSPEKAFTTPVKKYKPRS